MTSRRCRVCPRLFAAVDPFYPQHRLPKAVAFPDDVQQVDILKIGRSRVIVPKGQRWHDFFQSGPRVSEDFMTERKQPPPEEREPL